MSSSSGEFLFRLFVNNLCALFFAQIIILGEVHSFQFLFSLSDHLIKFCLGADNFDWRRLVDATGTHEFPTTLRAPHEVLCNFEHTVSAETIHCAFLWTQFMSRDHQGSAHGSSGISMLSDLMSMFSNSLASHSQGQSFPSARQWSQVHSSFLQQWQVALTGRLSQLR